MAKDPAFLFYPNDYIGGTMGMTFEEKGAYMELLMLQFHRGHMTDHMIGQTIGRLWDNVKDKFIKDEQGRFYNSRLDKEKLKRQTFVNSRKNNIKGKNQYSDQIGKGKKRGHTTDHMASHMENENENKDKDRNENEKRGGRSKFIKPTVEQVKAYCSEAGNKVDPNRFFDFYESKGWLVGKSPMKDWKAAVRNWERSENGGNNQKHKEIPKGMQGLKDYVEETTDET